MVFAARSLIDDSLKCSLVLDRQVVHQLVLLEVASYAIRIARQAFGRHDKLHALIRKDVRELPALCALIIYVTAKDIPRIPVVVLARLEQGRVVLVRDNNGVGGDMRENHLVPIDGKHDPADIA